jgi:hypothetical protein
VANCARLAKITIAIALVGPETRCRLDPNIAVNAGGIIAA